VTSPQTAVLAPSAVVAVPQPGTAGTLRLDGDVSVAPGDVLASGIGAAAPYGFLLKAVAVRHADGDTIVDAEPATLQEAIPETQFSRRFTFEEPSSRGSGRKAGAHRFQEAAKCTNDGGDVVIDGTAGIGSPQFEFEAGWGPLSGTKVKATASVTASASASASATGTASCSVGPIKLFETKLTPVTFSIGPVPVVLVPELEIELSGKGSVSAGVDTSVDASLTARAGAKYEDGKLSPISELEEEFAFDPPEPEAAATLAATLSSELEVSLYGVGGPAFSFDSGLELGADLNAEPWWWLDAPISFTAGLEVDALDVEAGPITVYERKFRLAEAPSREPMYRVVAGEAHYITSTQGHCAGPGIYPCNASDGNWRVDSWSISTADDATIAVFEPSQFAPAAQTHFTRTDFKGWSHSFQDEVHYSQSPCGIPIVRTTTDEDIVLPPGGDNAIRLKVRVDPPAAGESSARPRVALGDDEGLGTGIRDVKDDGARPSGSTRITYAPDSACGTNSVGPMDLFWTRRALDPKELTLRDWDDSGVRTPYSEATVYSPPVCANGRCKIRVSGATGYDDTFPEDGAYVAGSGHQRIRWWFDIESCFHGCA
jgi:hypothetical protein